MSSSFSAGEFPPTTSAAHPPAEPLQIQPPGFLEGTRNENQQQCQGVLNCRQARCPKLPYLSGDTVVWMLDTLIYMDSASPATSVSVKTVHSVLHHNELQSHRTKQDFWFDLEAFSITRQTKNNVSLSEIAVAGVLLSVSCRLVELRWYRWIRHTY